jgi:DNA gyrase/topoisomerase IV subunit A
MQCNVDIDGTVAIATEVKNESSTPDLDLTVDQMLDAIIEIKRILSHRIDSLAKVIEGHDQLTWIDNRSNEILEKIKIIIELSEQVYSNWVLSESVSKAINDIHSKNIARLEIDKYTHVLSDFRESIDDLTRIFFNLPHDEDFQNAARELEKLQ